MRAAITQAQIAANKDEVPVGAIIVKEGQLISSAHNSPITSCDPTAHAEISAIRKAATQIGNYRLINTTLYVTLEPCIMCVGAIIHARIDRLVFGAYDKKTGAVVSTMRSELLNTLNHRVDFAGGVLEGECSQLLKEFFSKKRRIKNSKDIPSSPS